MSWAIRCEGISKSYSKRHSVGIKELLVGRRRISPSRFNRRYALDDVTFAVPRGGAFGVVGMNGSGKSTLLSLLLGVMVPDGGRIFASGRMAALLTLGAGFHPELTGRQNVFLYGSILGMTLSEIRGRFDAIVDFSELGGAIDNPLRTYSTGMITRLGFSTIINTPADVLLIDEVLAVGDMDFQAKCLGFLQGFKMRGTLVIVSHDLASLQKLCDEGLCLHEGRVVAQGRISGVVTSYRALVDGTRSARVSG